MLVEITEKSHPIIIDLHYATTNNFTNEKIYLQPKCFINESALTLLERSITLASRQGLKFKIFDAFRPQKAQEFLWSVCPNPTYVANPDKGSNHTRGIAVDLTLLDLYGEELDMGTPFDDFSDQSHHGAILSQDQERNRYTLLGIMMSAGWDFYIKEWWHYQLFNSSTYPLILNSYGMMTSD